VIAVAEQRSGVVEHAEVGEEAVEATVRWVGVERGRAVACE
jgi:hypothetical protein